MRFKTAAFVGALALAAAIPGVVQAATWAQTTSNLNFRATAGGSAMPVAGTRSLTAVRSDLCRRPI